MQSLQIAKILVLLEIFEIFDDIVYNAWMKQNEYLTELDPYFDFSLFHIRRIYIINVNVYLA